jgi:hypothetical protein
MRNDGWSAGQDGDAVFRATLPASSASLGNIVINSTLSGIYPYSLTPFIERMIYGGVYMTIENMVEAYNPASWTKTAVTAASSTDGTNTIYQIIPTSTTTAALESATFSSTSIGVPITFSCCLRSTHESYTMPLTLRIRYAATYVVGGAYSVGDIAIPSTRNGYRYICTVAGGSGAEPAWTTTLGNTNTTGAATFRCDGSDVLAEEKVFLQPLSVSSDWSTFVVSGKVPPNVGISSGGGAAGSIFSAQIVFGQGSAVTLVALDFGYKDGLADGDVAKANRGQQVTLSQFEMPFVNNAAGTLGTVAVRDSLFWSEIAEPLGRSSRKLVPRAGDPWCYYWPARVRRKALRIQTDVALDVRWRRRPGQSDHTGQARAWRWLPESKGSRCFRRLRVLRG